LELNHIIYIFGFLFILSSLIKRLKIDHWVIRFFDFPQLQFLTLGVLVIASSFMWLDLSLGLNVIFLIGVMLVAVYQASLIYPYTIFHKKEIKSSAKNVAHDLKLLVSNVYQPNEEYKPLLKLIEREDPDIVLLVETNERWDNYVNSLAGKYPYSLKEPLDNMYGLIFYSRLALKDAQIRHIIKDDIPSVKCKLVLKSGLEVQFYGIHPEPPSPTENYRSTERDAELYLLAKEISNSNDIPTVVAGDLNDVAWSKSTRIFQKISGLLDPRKGRGFFNTFHAKYPIRWPLDHFFISHHFHLVDIQVHDSVGSDHFPISIALNHTSVSQNEDIESVDKEEKQEAKRQINKALSDAE